MNFRIIAIVVTVFLLFHANSWAEERREFVSSLGNEMLARCDLVIHGNLDSSRRIGSQITYTMIVIETLFGSYRSERLTFVSTEEGLVSKDDGKVIAAFRSTRSRSLEFIAKTVIPDDLDDEMLRVFREYVRIESIERRVLKVEALKAFIFTNFGSDFPWTRENAAYEFQGLARRSPGSFSKDEFLSAIAAAKAMPRSKARTYLLGGVDELLAYKFQDILWEDITGSDAGNRRTAAIVLIFALENSIGKFERLDIARVRLLRQTEENAEIRDLLADLERLAAERLQRN
ncbi:MAG: hypothetical protein NUW37_10100 [Planctomycetes bacterium]|nr:hypothetical protein [Planctomycetota bacterium]